MKKALALAMFWNLLADNAVNAGMPDCLSNICLRKAYTTEFFQMEGFSAKESKCEDEIIYSKESNNLRLSVVVLRYPLDGNDAYTPTNITRKLIFGKDRANFIQVTQAFRDKYGKPEREIIGGGDNPTSAYYDYRDSDDILRSAKINYEIVGGDKWVSFEELEDLRGKNERLERFSKCQKIEKAKDASKIIPD